MEDPWESIENDPWSTEPKGGGSITRVTRRDIFDYLRTSPYSITGDLDEVSFLGRLYDLGKLPSHDHRFTTAARDITQHRINNYDWPDDWMFSDPRLELGSGPDEVLLEFLAQLVHPVVRTKTDDAQDIVRILNDLLKHDGWELVAAETLSSRTIYAPRRLGQGTTLALDHARNTASSIDSAYVSRQITRMEGAVRSDPELAIGTAKDFLETICKTILDNTSGGTYSKNDDLMALFKKTSKLLQLSPNDVDGSDAAAGSIRRILGSLGQVVQATAELRNALGTGHGRSGTTASVVETRHAHLVVGAAAAVGTFLFETYEHRGTTPVPPF